MPNAAAEEKGSPPGPGKGPLGEVWMLAKPRITAMVLAATAVGYLLATAGKPDWGHLALVLGGTLLLGAGNNALNQYMERETDGLMARTRERPLPAGRMRPRTVLLLGAACGAAGLAVLALAANLLTAAVGVAVIVTYLLCYTPMKRVSGLNTLVGAVPGALPPVLGWVAAGGGLGQETLALFILLFVWQPPHFLAIAYLYREDYARAGMPMLTVVDPVGAARRQMLLYSVTLVPVSMYPVTIGLGGELYFYGALVLSLGFLAAAIVMVFRTNTATARMMLKVSVIYLPLLLGLLVYDHAGW